MHRVDAPGHVLGAYFDGNPALGQQATQVRAAHLNDIQENICQAIEAASIALVKGDGGQLLAAIQWLVASGALTAAEVLALLVTVDGSGSGLDADLLDGLHAAAFVQASGFDSGSNAEGYWAKRPDGAGGTIIEQWGIVSSPGMAEGPFTKNFPIPFTDAASVAVNITSINSDGGVTTADDAWAQYRSHVVGSFNGVIQVSTTGALCDGYTWSARGR